MNKSENDIYFVVSAHDFFLFGDVKERSVTNVLSVCNLITTSLSHTLLSILQKPEKMVEKVESFHYRYMHVIFTPLQLMLNTLHFD